MLEKYAPDQLLVEIADSDLASGKIGSYPPEMRSAYEWAKKKGIGVRGFDSKIDVLAEGLGEADNQRAIEEQKKVMGALTWKDFNKQENLKKLLDVGAWLVDSVKNKERNREMMDNIRNVMDAEGTVVVLAGCVHLRDIKASFPKAQFPLGH